MRINVLGVGFDNVTMEEAVARGVELIHQEGSHYVVTPNPEIVEVCRENLAAKIAVNGADLVLPDGIGVIKGAAMLGTPLKEKTPGIEFAGHPRKFPDIAAADGAARTQEDKSQPGGQTLAMIHRRGPSSAGAHRSGGRAYQCRTAWGNNRKISVASGIFFLD